MNLPLEGIRVLAISQFGAGPFATLNLADLGAEVIKIEDPKTGGEVSRFVPPYQEDGDSLYFQSWNRNKRSITLNLRTNEGVAVFHDLVRVSNVVFNNLRGDQPSKLGLTYRSLESINAKIVCCSLNGFGSEGPRAKEPGYDYLMQAYAGYMSITGDPCGPPSSCGVSFIDHAAGFAAALGIVSSVLSAQRTGRGRDLEVSLLDTAYSMLTYLAVWNLNRGFEPVRYPGSSHQTLVPVQTFRTSDGYITIFCGKQKFWELLCGVFEDSALAEDPRFRSFEDRMKNRDDVLPRVQSHFLRKTTDEWIQVLTGLVPCAPVRTVTEALADPDLQSRGTVIEVDHPKFGKIQQVNTPVRFPESLGRTHRRAPWLGEDTDQVLMEYLNYDPHQIARLRKLEAI